MKLNITKDTVFYILAPANVDTGGPKDLHQLAQELRRLEKKVFMYYFPNNQENPIHKNYKSFNLPHVNEIEDSEKNVLIVPEINTTILISKKYKYIQKVLWWLSLDFYFISNFNENFHKYLRSLIKIPFNLINFFNKLTKNHFGNLSLPKYLKFLYLTYPFSNTFKVDGITMNLSQSEYQQKVLKTKKIDSVLLKDYIRKEYFDASEKIFIKNKKNIICYNPGKSSNFMKKIIQDNSNTKFMPLSGYDINELIKILSESKIYMDFGFHPGVDHLPREAAILRNCIITNKEGSAFYQESVPINIDFKFDEKKKNLISIKNKINNIFNNFEAEIDLFKDYRNAIQNEKKIFKKQLYDIFT